MLIIMCVGGVSAWNISIDNTGSSSIVWNTSDKPGLITFVSYDGINLSNYDPNATQFVQSDLSSNTFHNIKVIADGQTATFSTVTNMSAAEKVNTLINEWFLVGVVLALFILGFVIHWLLFWIGSFVSLYGLADYLLKHPNLIVSIWSLPFLIFGALFVLGFVLWAFRKKKGFR